jgi:hypothetical protein
MKVFLEDRLPLNILGPAGSWNGIMRQHICMHSHTVTEASISGTHTVM